MSKKKYLGAVGETSAAPRTPRAGGPTAKRQPTAESRRLGAVGLGENRLSAGGAAPNSWWYHSRPMSHSYINNHLHIVYSTKDRKDLIPPEFEPRLYSFIAEIAREEGVPLIAAGGMPNHSRLLILLPATLCLADVVNMLKTNSSRFMRQQRIEFEWQKGYGAFAVSASQIEQVKAYIRNQKEHHKKRTFEQEFVAMLKKAGIDYDPRYVFG